MVGLTLEVEVEGAVVTQDCLWVFQSAFWHCAEQYRRDLQREQILNVVFGGSSSSCLAHVPQRRAGEVEGISVGFFMDEASLFEEACSSSRGRVFSFSERDRFLNSLVLGRSSLSPTSGTELDIALDDSKQTY